MNGSRSYHDTLTDRIVSTFGSEWVPYTSEGYSKAYERRLNRR